jgi:hypothetical protein
MSKSAVIGSGVKDDADRYQGIHARIFPSTQRRIDWAGSPMKMVEAQRRERLSADRLVERQAWRDRRLRSLAAYKRCADRIIGEQRGETIHGS